MKAKDLAAASVIAALYALLVVALPFISFLLWQVRIADALLMMSTVLGWPAVIGVTLGCFLGNFIAAPWGAVSLTLIDAVLGSIANFVASLAAYIVAYRKDLRFKIIGAIVEIVLVSLIVGAYLKYLLEWAFNIDMPVLISIAGVVPGSIISIGFVGTALTIALEKRIIKRVLQLHHD